MKKFDLSKLPLPQSIQSVDYEKNFNCLLNNFKERMPEYDAEIESDPVIKILQACAYGLTLYEQRTNDSIKSNLISFAKGADLDHLGILLNECRNTDESDEHFRQRILNALEKVTSAGSQLAYEALAFESAQEVVDVVAYDNKHKPGVVFIIIQSNESTDGIASTQLINKVQNYLNAPERKPLGAQVIVSSVEPLEYTIKANVVLDKQSDKQLVLKTMNDNIQSLIANYHKINANIPLSEIYARLNIEGVSYVEELFSPKESVKALNNQTPFCSKVEITEVIK